MRINLVKYSFKSKKRSRIIFVNNFVFNKRLLIILIAKMLKKFIFIIKYSFTVFAKKFII